MSSKSSNWVISYDHATNTVETRLAADGPRIPWDNATVDNFKSRFKSRMSKSSAADPQQIADSLAESINTAKSQGEAKHSVSVDNVQVVGKTSVVNLTVKE